MNINLIRKTLQFSKELLTPHASGSFPDAQNSPTTNANPQDMLSKAQPLIQGLLRAKSKLTQPFREGQNIIEQQTPFKQVGSFLQEQKSELDKLTPEQVAGQGMVRVGNRYIGFDVAALEKVGSKLVKPVVKTIGQKITGGLLRTSMTRNIKTITTKYKS